MADQDATFLSTAICYHSMGGQSILERLLYSTNSTLLEYGGWNEGRNPATIRLRPFSYSDP